MHTLHTRAARIFSSWAAEEQQQQSKQEEPVEEAPPEEPPRPVTENPGDAVLYIGEPEQAVDAGASTLWSRCWCPLLQGKY